MRRLTEEPWFHDKQIGWGLTPASWQGWAATAGFVAVVLVTSISSMHRGPRLGIIAGAMLGFNGLAVVPSTWLERPGPR